VLRVFFSGRYYWLQYNGEPDWNISWRRVEYKKQSRMVMDLRLKKHGRIVLLLAPYQLFKLQLGRNIQKKKRT